MNPDDLPPHAQALIATWPPLTQDELELVEDFITMILRRRGVDVPPVRKRPPRRKPT